MKNNWYVNWLVVITVVLFISASSLFFVSIQDSLGFTKCAYGDVVVDNGKNCICDSKGKVVCEENSENSTSVRAEEFNTQNLSYSYDYLNLLDVRGDFFQEVRFVNISQVGNSLRVVLEKKSLCNADNFVAPQVGFYKLEGNRMIFTIASNLVDSSFNIPCVSESSFEISSMPVEYGEDFNIYYQDELGTLIPSGNCSYQGFLRNDGDVYNSNDGCNLCSCKLGQNICEKEPKCLQ